MAPDRRGAAASRLAWRRRRRDGAGRGTRARGGCAPRRRACALRWAHRTCPGDAAARDRTTSHAHGPLMTDSVTPDVSGTNWIAELSDDQCAEIFWLYLEDPDVFLRAHRPELIGQAMRFALRLVAMSGDRPAQGGTDTA